MIIQSNASPCAIIVFYGKQHFVIKIHIRSSFFVSLDNHFKYKVSNSNHFSYLITVFRERVAPEEGYLAGYGTIVKHYDLQVPLPDRLAIISRKHGKSRETADWIVLSPPYKPADSLMGHLTFALKYEGIDLGILKKVFEKAG